VSGQWRSYPTADAAAEACSRHMVSCLEQALLGERDATLAISGGSTPRLLFRHLAKSGLPWERIQLFWVDERAVPPTDDQSNFKLANETLIQPAHIPHRNVHRIHAEMRPDAAAQRYMQEIRQVFDLEPGEVPHFDVMHRGVGPDAHTASLFPGEPLIEDREGIAAAVYVEKLNQWRITLLPAVLLAARHTVMLVAGEDKAEAVRQIFHEPYNPLQYPAQVTHANRSVHWFLDEAAARGIQAS
jgi:6-phosphogluconolactonase